MPTSLTQRFGGRIERLLADARQHALFRLVVSEKSDTGTLAMVVRNVLLRIHLYGPSLTRAIFHAIGRIATSDQETARILAELEFAEAPHPELAFRDYLSLGGDPAARDDLTLSPAAFAVAATMEALARHENPLAFAGALYQLEATTPLFIEAVAPSLEASPTRAFTEFLALHRTQDVEHAATLLELIDRLAAQDERNEAAIRLGFDSFSIVYPFPVWDESLDQVHREGAARA